MSSRNRKNLTLMWRKLNPMEFRKDVVVVPHDLARRMDMKAHIVCGYDSGIQPLVSAQEDESLCFEKRPLGHSALRRMPVGIGYIMAHARRIDALMLFHWRPEAILYLLCYKLFNPNGGVYVKLDTISGKEFDLSRCSASGRWLRRVIYRAALHRTDVLSCETSLSHAAILSAGNDFPELAGKLVRLPDVPELPASDALRCHQFLFVGRIGTHQKNSEMLLKALDGLDMGDWKLVLAGPVEESFKPALNALLEKRPELRDKIELRGPVSDPQELADLYAQSSVFVLTSRWESYGIVLAEAAASGCHILTTDVGAARDILAHANGDILQQEDADGLRERMRLIVSGSKTLEFKPVKDKLIQDYEDSVSDVSRLLCR